MKDLSFLFLLFLTSCQTNSSIENYQLDFVIAKTALERAEKVSADKNFPKSYQSAKQFYNKARLLYEKKRFLEAKKYCEKSIKLSEKIELHSLYKKKREEEVPE